MSGDSVSSNEKWLLHTWSLSVEWQFYIIYPLVLMVANRVLSLCNIKKLLLFSTILGFIFCIVATTMWPTPSYYLLPTRAWEMMIGGLAYLYPFNLDKTKKRAIETLALLMILTSYALFSSETPWPGYHAILPVLGTYLVLIVNSQNSFTTNNPIFQAIGKWSYSIYLWHWPIVVFLTYYDLQRFWVIGIVLSVVFGYLSFRLIESRRFTVFPSWKQVLQVKPIWLSGVIGLIAIFVFKEAPNKYLYQMPNSVLNSIERKPYACFDKQYMHEDRKTVCELTTGEKKVLAIGDSHTYSVLPVIERIAKTSNLALSYTGYSGCPPLINVSPIRNDQHVKDCKTLNEKTLQFAIDNKVDTVFLAARWTYYTVGNYSGTGIQYLKSEGTNTTVSQQESTDNLKRGLELTLQSYSNNNIDVVLMLQVPMQEIKPNQAYYKSLGNNKLVEQLLEGYSVLLEKSVIFQKSTNNLIYSVANQFDNVTVIDPTSTLCNKDTCLIGDLDYSYYFDEDHLSIKGSNMLYSPIKNALVK
ncbi:acyltransferase family protein [Vibrio chagasii]|uniref:acyltransferase family protein n=1 Tax=Vibrio chagasii TaxID=170679 RepID=UPI003DA854C2